MVNRILTVAVIYFAVAACTYFLQRSMMYFPSKNIGEPKDYGAPELKVVELTAKDGIKTDSWYKPAENGLPTILFFQGNAGNITGRLRKLHHFWSKGYGVLLLGYRGYGNNPGNPSEKGIVGDAVAAFDYLKKSGIKPENMVFYGESLGTGVAVALANIYEPGGVILEAPFSSALDIAKQSYWYLPVSLLMKDKFDSVGKIKNIKAPILHLHGEEDEVVPIKFGKKLSKAAGKNISSHYFKEGRHMNLTDIGGFEVMDKWLIENF